MESLLKFDAKTYFVMSSPSNGRINRMVMHSPRLKDSRVLMHR